MADRTVRMTLQAKVAGYVQGVNQAKLQTTDLARRMVETGASADKMRRRLEAATKALPKIEIDANSNPAEVKFAQLRRQLESLSSKRIGVDVSAGDALAEIAEVERELARLESRETNVDVRMDIGAALAELRAMQAEVSRLDGQTADVRVDADVSGAMSGIATVGASLAALAAAPALVSIGVGAVGLGAAFGVAGAGAAGFAAVALPALGRVNAALKQQESAAGGAGGATKSAGQSAAQAAQQELQLEQASKRVTDAKRAVKQAEQDLTAARQEARRAVEELGRAIEDQQLSEESAALSVEEARKRLNEVRADPKADDLERRRAELNVREAEARYEGEKRRTRDLAKEKADADKAGINGSKEVIAAKEKLRKANEQADLAEKQLRVTQLQQKAAMSGAAGAAGGAASKMAELSRAEQALARDIKGFQDGYKEWQQSLEGDVFPAITGGLHLVQSQLPRISPLVRTAAQSFQVLEDDAAKALKAPFWGEFLYDLNTEMPGAIIGLGRTTGNVFGGMAGVVDAFLPYTGDVVDGLEKGSQKFAEWGQKLKDSPDFKAFINLVKTEGPVIAQLIEDVAVSLGHTGVALMPLGVSALDGLGLLAKLTRDMDPEQIRAVAIAVGLIYTAVKVGGAVGAGLDALSMLRNRASQVKDAASGAATKLGAIGQAAGAVAGVAVAATALHELAREASGANISVEGLTTSMDRFAKTGRITGDLATGFGKDLKGSGLLVEGFGDSLRRTFDPTFLDAARTGFTDALKSVTFGVADLDPAVEKFHELDEALAGMVDSGNVQGAQEGFRLLAKNAQDAGVPIDVLKARLPEYAEALDAASTKSGTAADALKGMGGASDEARRKLDDFQTSINTFTSKTDAQAMVADLARKYRDVKTAVHEAGGKLNFFAGMSDKQREAIVKAREKFAGYLSSVDATGKKQADLARATGDSATATDRQKLAILQAAPKMFELAGKSKEAREAIYRMGEAAGVSRTDMNNAKEAAGRLRDEISKLKSKDIRVGLDTSKAREALNKLIRDVSTAVANVAASIKPKRAGGIEAYRAGGVEAYAAGGVRSTPPMMAKSPTILMGEGADKEAFIPYERQYRARAEMLLAQVAGDFGKALVPVGQPMASPIRSAPLRPVTSRPIQGSTSAGRAVTREEITQIVVQAIGTTRQRGDRTLHIENMNVHENISPRELAEDLHLLDRRG